MFEKKKRRRITYPIIRISSSSTYCEEDVTALQRLYLSQIPLEEVTLAQKLARARGRAAVWRLLLRRGVWPPDLPILARRAAPRRVASSRVVARCSRRGGDGDGDAVRFW